MKRAYGITLCLLVTLGESPELASAQTTIDVEVAAGNVFVPRDITINVGDTVHWFWTGGLHYVESGVIIFGAGVADGFFRSGDATAASGATFDLTFDQAFLDANSAPNNFYDYFCVVHASVDMAGTVTVQQQAPVCTQDSDCLDTNVCNGSETCQNNACVAGTTLDCDDSIACTTDSCDTTAG